MNAVNLMPARTAGGPDLRLSVSRPFLGLLAGLGVVLLATVLFVSAHAQVTSRQADLHRLQTAAAGWNAAAAAFDPSIQAKGVRDKTISEVRELATARYDWSALLRQIAGRLPAHAALSSLEATAPSSVPAAASDAAAGGMATTTTNGIQISACATSQTVVAQTMTSLRHVAGVSQVTLGSSGRAAAGTSTGGGSCSLPVQFSITLAFGPSTTSAASSGSVVGTEAAHTEPAR